MVQSGHPAIPGAAGLRLNALVAHARQCGVVDLLGRSARCGCTTGFGFLYDVSAGGSVGFTRLSHASANEALEILIAWHRHFSFGYTTVLSPAARHGDAKDRRNRSGSLPPFASQRTPAGAESKEVGRGSPPTA